MRIIKSQRGALIAFIGAVMTVACIPLPGLVYESDSFSGINSLILYFGTLLLLCIGPVTTLVGLGMDFWQRRTIPRWLVGVVTFAIWFGFEIVLWLVAGYSLRAFGLA